MATKKRSNLTCVQCSKKLIGRQRLYCSKKCRSAYARKQSKVTAKVTGSRPDTFNIPEVERQQSRPDTFTLHEQFHQIKGERDRLLVEVSELKKQNQQLTAAALDKAKYEGAYMALVEGKKEAEKMGETVQGDVVEVKKEGAADNDSLWKRVGRSIRKRF